MNRAIVMSLEGNRAVVLAPGGQFIKVPNRGHLQVGDEIELEEGSELPGMRRRARRRAWAAGSAAGAAAILLLAGSLWLRTPSVVAYVSMDVNPSIELGLDSQERVRELHALNRDAEPIVAEVKFKGKDVGEVAGEIADTLAERHILNGGDSEVVLASVAVKKVDGQWEAEVAEKMKQAIEKAGAVDSPDPADSTGSAGEGANAGQDDAPDASGETKSVPEVTTLSLPKEVREEAKANGLSAGKMAFWLKAESQGHEISFDELKHSSLKKIAASWGGVKQVLGDGQSASAGGGSDWKQLLKDAQEKVQEQKKEQKEAKKEEQEKRKASVPSAKPPGAANVPASAGKAGSSGKGSGPSKDWGKTKGNDANEPRGQSKSQDKGQDKEQDKNKDKVNDTDTDKGKDKDKGKGKDKEKDNSKDEEPSDRFNGNSGRSGGAKSGGSDDSQGQSADNRVSSYSLSIGKGFGGAAGSHNGNGPSVWPGAGSEWSFWIREEANWPKITEGQRSGTGAATGSSSGRTGVGIGGDKAHGSQSGDSDDSSGSRKSNDRNEDH